MKKVCLIAVLALTMVQFAMGMIPGPPLLLECPKCGEEKRMMSIISGNTFGATQWSDMYREAPMLPTLSEVQKCPHCNSYFLLSQAKDRFDEEEGAPFSPDTGRLSYQEMKEALSLLENDSLTINDRINIRLEFLHRYNDAFRDIKENHEIYSDDMSLERNDADWRLNQENIKALIALLNIDDNDNTLLIAELYREAGYFESCLNTLKKYWTYSKYEKAFMEKLQMKAWEKDDRLFLIDE